MEFLDVIKNRKSCRCFKDEEPSMELIEQVLKAGILAPSAHNKMPWKAVVMHGEAKNQLTKIILDELKVYKSYKIPISSSIRSSRILRDAPINIYILMENVEYIGKERFGEILDDSYFSYIDQHTRNQNLLSVGTAIENMLLEAQDLNLGAICISEMCYAKDFTAKYFQDTLGYKNYELVSSIALGYAYEEMLKAHTVSKSFEDLVDIYEVGV